MRLFVLIASGLMAASCSADPELASSPDADRIFNAKCDVPPATTGGASFEEIYEQLFSAKGVARCQDSTCHGVVPTDGGVAPTGPAMGIDRKGAYDGLIAYGQVNPTATTTDDPPSTVKFLLNTLQPPASGGSPRMPKPLCGNRILNAAEIERLKAWGRAGAPDSNKM